MRRPSRPMPAELRELKPNHTTGQYEITEDEITYSMTLEETRSLREYFRGFMPGNGMLYPTISRWYKGLARAVKKKVTRTGKIPQESIDFYPDPFFEI